MSIEFGGTPVRLGPPEVPTLVAGAPPPTALIGVDLPELTQGGTGGQAVVPVAGPPGPPGASGTALDQVLMTGTAATALSGHRVVTRRPDGQLGYADCTTPEHVHAPLWITLGAAEAGAEIEVLAYGTLTEPSWAWIPALPLYLGTTGVITQVPPTTPGAVFSAHIGVATSPTAALIDRQPSIILA